MPPIEMGPARPVSAVDVRVARQAGGLPEQKTRTNDTASTVALSDAVSAGDAPVDTDRVAMIRKAVESGTYPVVPAKIADAMIAAGMLLRKGE